MKRMIGTIARGRGSGEWECYIDYRLVLIIKVGLPVSAKTQRAIAESALREIMVRSALSNVSIQHEHKVPF